MTPSGVQGALSAGLTGGPSNRRVLLGKVLFTWTRSARTAESGTPVSRVASTATELKLNLVLSGVFQGA